MAARMTSGSRQSGFTYVMVLILVAISGAFLAAVGTMWSSAAQREKEAELLFIGEEFRTAIASYYERSPGSVKMYPRTLEDLLYDKRYLTLQRHLRRIYIDPMTGQPDWATIPAPDGGVMGVHSRAKGPARKQLGAMDVTSRYDEWRFLYEPSH